MLGNTWLAYFEQNARADRAPHASLALEVPEALRASLIVSLGRFQLGEAAGGRIHAEIATHPDRALEQGTRRAVQLYIEEEWRHSRELALIITQLGGRTQQAHWTNGAFTKCRRLLGLRPKLLTLAVAEIAGIVYYRALADGAGSRELARALGLIASEEARHLDFQAAFFRHAVSLVPWPLRAPYRWLLRGLLLAILTAALLVLLLDHGHVLRRVGARPRQILQASLAELGARRFLTAEPAPATARVLA